MYMIHPELIIPIQSQSLLMKSPQSPKETKSKIVWGQHKVGELPFPNFKPYYKVTIIKAMWYCQKDRHRDQ